eukprot:TRINITY_DN6746_c0_g2_i3.p1 TRINITY_DN6746_c0_g2~~TRINITY_DN6746_c0_g2_i3.p1  ORF type:complete len:139 (-),score=1.95 TRINITY_DN6746_c0_g2_i3:384-800(-)
MRCCCPWFCNNNPSFYIILMHSSEQRSHVVSCNGLVRHFLKHIKSRNSTSPRLSKTHNLNTLANPSRKSALNVFCALAVEDALLFPVEKAYHGWNIIRKSLILMVNNELGLPSMYVHMVWRFFQICIPDPSTVAFLRV